MRGKVPAVSSHFEWQGITPAHAGKRPQERQQKRQQEDHPRPCGKSASSSSVEPRQWDHPRPCGKSFRRAPDRHPHRITPAHAGKRLRKRRNTGIFVFQISRFHSVSHTPDTSYGNRPALYVRRLHRTPAALQASKAYDRARWAAYAWLFAVCPHTGS